MCAECSTAVHAVYESVTTGRIGRPPERGQTASRRRVLPDWASIDEQDRDGCRRTRHSGDYWSRVLDDCRDYCSIVVICRLTCMRIEHEHVLIHTITIGKNRR